MPRRTPNCIKGISLFITSSPTASSPNKLASRPGVVHYPPRKHRRPILFRGVSGNQPTFRGGGVDSENKINRFFFFSGHTGTNQPHFFGTSSVPLTGPWYNSSNEGTAFGTPWALNAQGTGGVPGLNGQKASHRLALIRGYRICPHVV